ncbi:MAG: membrane protein insertase YidC [Elusimicrobia bacterium]|nr:membrane protein insertase YidC [Elusimicrobiota bacterium]
MDKNLIIAVVLSGVVYLGWFKLIEHYYGKPEVPLVAGSAVPGAPAGGSPPTASAAAGEPGMVAAEFRSPEPEKPARKGGLDGAMAFSASGVDIKIQPLGAGLVSVAYPGPLGPVELVPDPYPGFLAAWPDLRFSRVGSDANWPVFEAKLPNGVLIRKEYIFGDRDGMKTLRLTFTNPSEAPAAVEPWSLALGPGLGIVDSEKKENPSLWHSVVLLADTPRPNDYQALDLEKEPAAVPGKVSWAGVSNRYFLAAAFPPAETFKGATSGAKPVPFETTGWLGGKKMTEVLEPWIRFDAAALTLPAGGSSTVEVPFYLGPKGYTHLKSFERGLERSVDFGWFDKYLRLGRFTLRVLHKFHSWTGNWGWAIIMLTLCLQAFLLPLSYKQMKSMAGMKKVQPEVQKIQQKFAKDPKRLQQEMMEVYKKHGVNPLGGCLPILLQMPIFITLFNTLREAWELHGAGWMFWIKDLSAHDPYYVLPLIMGGIMFLQNQMNPQPTADPAQAQMMKIMPVMFTFMFLNFPSGLVLYWLTNSVIGFVFQMAMKKRLEA